MSGVPAAYFALISETDRIPAAALRRHSDSLSHGQAQWSDQSSSMQH